MTDSTVPKQVQLWREFAALVEDHIVNYVIPQYGDEEEDLATAYTLEDCVKQSSKYLARVGRSSRPGEEARDLLKTAHYVQKAHLRVKKDD